MSIIAEKNVYESGSEDRGSNDKLCLEVYESSGQFIYMPKIESDTDENTVYVSEETFDDRSETIIQENVVDSMCHATGESRMDHWTVQNICKEEQLCCESEAPSMNVSSSPRIHDPWTEGDFYEDANVEAANFEATEIGDCRDYRGEECDYKGLENDDGAAASVTDDSDEETIATFLTAAGQRLALYAVEDSDQVFAVAVYDESGQPPTNFQFLIKSDVERLIGEGAVRTVKKPTPMRKQRFTEESIQVPLLEDMEHLRETKYHDDRPEIQLVGAMEDTMEDTECSPGSDYRSTFDHVTTKSAFEKISLYSPSDHACDDDEAYEEEIVPEYEGLVEQSTVDHLFMDNDEPDDELTFADIEETMKEFHTVDKRWSSMKVDDEFVVSNIVDKSIDPCSLISYENGTPESIDESILGLPDVCNRTENMIVPTVNSSTNGSRRTNITRKNHVTSSLIRRRDNNLKQQREREKESLEREQGKRDNSLLITSNEENKNESIDSNNVSDIITLSPKAKRPRKQQLTMVNRGDSEIIIQPATFSNDGRDNDDDTGTATADDDDRGRKRRRKRIRRKRESMVRQGSVRYKVKASVAKRLEKRRGRRAGRTRQVVDSPKKQYEIIEIDVDEKDRLAGGAVGIKQKHIVEITIDENNKDKGSSDKENEVIMVGDSDEETTGADSSRNGSTAASGATAAPTVATLRCEHCSRNFRQKRALGTHARLCKKSPENVDRLEERDTISDDSSVPKAKQFVCKICQEKFDVVVVLARHVKAMHSLRKKGHLPDETATAAATLMRTRKERTTISRETDKIAEVEQNVDTIRSLSTAVTRAETETKVTATSSGRRRNKTRRRNTSQNRPAWKGQKLHCSDCTKWFSSAAMLASHSLQHATKKSEKQIRRCQTCKKIFKSRLLYLRHLRMHSRAKKLQKKLHHTRQATVKLATLRMRGRPRKL